MGVKYLAMSVAHTVIAFSLVLGTLALLGLWPSLNDPATPGDPLVARPATPQFDPVPADSTPEESLLQSLVATEELFDKESILDVASEYAALDIDPLIIGQPRLEPASYRSASFQPASQQEPGSMPSSGSGHYFATLDNRSRYGQQAPRLSAPGLTGTGPGTPPTTGIEAPGIGQKEISPLSRRPTATTKATSPPEGIQTPTPTTSGSYPGSNNPSDSDPLTQDTKPADVLHDDAPPVGKATSQPTISPAVTASGPDDIRSIPEPGILAMMLAGFLLLATIRHRSTST